MPIQEKCVNLSLSQILCQILIAILQPQLRASYRIVDHRERQIAPHSLAFTYSGQRLYCGFEDAIEVFDVGQPGEGERRHTSPTKKSKDGLKGSSVPPATILKYESES